MSRDTEISAEFPFESKYVTVHGLRMHYVDEGSGDPILFLHGSVANVFVKQILPQAIVRKQTLSWRPMTLNRAAYALALLLSLVPRVGADAQDLIRPTVGDSTVVAVITPAGAIVEFPGVAQLRFPAGAFVAPETVTVRLSNLPSTDKGREYYGLGRGGSPPYHPQNIAVRATTQPRLELEVVFMLSAASLDCAPADLVPRVFREFIGGGSMEALVMYQALPSTIDVSAQTIRARVVAPPVEPGPELHEVFHVGCFQP